MLFIFNKYEYIVIHISDMELGWREVSDVKYIEYWSISVNVQAQFYLYTSTNGCK